MMPYYFDLLGKPFKYEGRGPLEYDCYGLMYELYRRAGIQLPVVQSVDDPEYQNSEFIKGINEVMVPVDNPMPMDMVLLQIIPKYVTHCGVYIDHGNFIHIMSKTCVVVENISHPLWSHRFRGFYRYKGEL